ncbi:Htaa protein [Agrococcus baldri]|uniref:Htaa protein n=1 Tax=Agrococcus baldri TaxID=153730 RepID=A0AA94KZZ8_9MICO|nr:HtaA domain-containing protein [Agrococcus baldri]SFS14843.1 Htaa protein [Agrococcus baldri]
MTASGTGALVWGIKASLLSYVRGMSDGSVEASAGAEAAAGADAAGADASGGTEAGDGTAAEGGFRFRRRDDASAPYAFRGTVVLSGHSGMMRVVIADPALVESGGSWALEIADPDDASIRLRFATIEAFDGRRARGTALTEDGADLFFGPYTAGTPLDDPIVVVQ